MFLFLPMQCDCCAFLGIYREGAYTRAEEPLAEKDTKDVVDFISQMKKEIVPFYFSASLLDKEDSFYLFSMDACLVFKADQDYSDPFFEEKRTCQRTLRRRTYGPFLLCSSL